MYVRNEPIPDELEVEDAIKFAKSVRSYRKKPITKEKKIEIALQKITPREEAFLLIIDTARPHLKVSEFEAVWDAVEFSLDLSVDVGRGPVWEARRFHSGKLFFRDSDRVLEIDQEPTLSISISNTKLTKTLKGIKKKIGSTERNRPLGSGFSLIHHFEEGIFWTSEIPKKMSSTGQTIVMLPLSWVKMWEDNTVDSSMLLRIAERSESNHVVIRVFKDRSFIHRTYYGISEFNKSDEYLSDRVNHRPDLSSVLSDGDNDSKVVTNESYFSMIIATVRNECTNLFISTFMQAMISMKIEMKYFPYNRHDLNYGNNFFSKDPNLPVTYDGVPLIYEHVKNNLENLIVFGFDYSIGETIKGFARKTKQAISVGLISYLSANSRVSMERYNAGKVTHDEFDWGSILLSKKLKNIEQSLYRQFSKYCEQFNNENYDREEEEREWLRNHLDQIYVLVHTQVDMSPSRIQADCLEISKDIPGRVKLLIPKYGYYQGFAEGELDTGNEISLVPSDEDGGWAPWEDNDD